MDAGQGLLIVRRFGDMLRSKSRLPLGGGGSETNGTKQTGFKSFQKYQPALLLLSSCCIWLYYFIIITVLRSNFHLIPLYVGHCQEVVASVEQICVSRLDCSLLVSKPRKKQESGPGSKRRLPCPCHNKKAGRSRC